MQSIDLFRNMQIRDLNGVDPHVVREKHIPLFFDQDWRSTLEPILGPDGRVDRAKISAYVQTSEFGKRASIAGFVARKFSGLRNGETILEWKEAGDLAYLAFLLGRKPQSENDLSNLSTAWESASKKWDLTPSLNLVPSSWLLDLYCLYFEPENFFDYRRILAAIRRISICNDVYDPEVIPIALGPEDQLNVSSKRFRSRLLRSRILIPAEALPAVHEKHVASPPPHADPRVDKNIEKNPVQRETEKTRTRKPIQSSKKTKPVKRAPKGAGRLRKKES